MSATVVLIDLDVILDTRLGTLALLNSDAAKALLEPVPYDAYINRNVDDWALLSKGAVTNEAFKERYKRRDVDTLKASMLTNFVQLLTAITDDLERQMLHTPQVSSVELHVNHWPYELSDEEKTQFELCVSSYAGVYTTVKMVNYPPEAITPNFLDKRIAGYITYSFNEWLSHHHYALTQKSIPQVVLMAAALFIKEPTEEERAAIGVKDYFMATEHVFITQLKLVLANPEYFSLITL